MSVTENELDLKCASSFTIEKTGTRVETFDFKQVNQLEIPPGAKVRYTEFEKRVCVLQRRNET